MTYLPVIRTSQNKFTLRVTSDDEDDELSPAHMCLQGDDQMINGFN